MILAFSAIYRAGKYKGKTELLGKIATLLHTFTCELNLRKTVVISKLYL